MRSIPFDEIAHLLDGHVDCLISSGRVQPVRYRVSDAPFIDPAVVRVGAFAGGIRLRMKTNSTVVRLELSHIQAFFPGREWWTKDYELRINGERVRDVSPVGGAQITIGSAVSGEDRATLTLANLPAGENHIELWFPPAAQVAIIAVQIDDNAEWAQWPDTRRRVLFHGSSITQAVDANGGSQTWPGVASDLANVRHLNLGWAGSCLISGFAARILRDEPADAIVLELGANVWETGLLKERIFVDATQSMLAIIREKHATTPIAIVSPIAFKAGDDATNEGGISLGRMRELLENIVATRVAAGDANIHHLPGPQLSGFDDLDNLPDGIHPNVKGNRAMGERFYEHMLAPGKALAADACSAASNR